VHINREADGSYVDERLRITRYIEKEKIEREKFQGNSNLVNQYVGRMRMVPIEQRLLPPIFLQHHTVIVDWDE
jgi:hypothetical protein